MEASVILDSCTTAFVPALSADTKRNRIIWFRRSGRSGCSTDRRKNGRPGLDEKKLTGAAFVIAAFSFALTHVLQSNLTVSLLLFCIAAILLDMAVSGNLVLGQQAIYGLGDEIRGRVNGLFMAVFFVGGAVGSALGGWSYAHGNWTAASMFGFTLPVVAFVYFLTEKKQSCFLGRLRVTVVPFPYSLSMERVPP